MGLWDDFKKQFNNTNDDSAYTDELKEQDPSMFNKPLTSEQEKAAKQRRIKGTPKPTQTAEDLTEVGQSLVDTTDDTPDEPKGRDTIRSSPYQPGKYKRAEFKSDAADAYKNTAIKAGDYELASSIQALSKQLKNETDRMDDRERRADMIQAFTHLAGGLIGLASLRDPKSYGIKVNTELPKKDWEKKRDRLLQRYRADVADIKDSINIQRQQEDKTQNKLRTDAQLEQQENQFNATETGRENQFNQRERGMAQQAEDRIIDQRRKDQNREEDLAFRNDKEAYDRVLDGMKKTSKGQEGMSLKDLQKEQINQINNLRKFAVNPKSAELSGPDAAGALTQMAVGAGLPIGVVKQLIDESDEVFFDDSAPEVAQNLLKQIEEFRSMGGGQPEQESESDIVTMETPSGQRYQMPRKYLGTEQVKGHKEIK